MVGAEVFVDLSVMDCRSRASQNATTTTLAARGKSFVHGVASDGLREGKSVVKTERQVRSV